MLFANWLFKAASFLKNLLKFLLSFSIRFSVFVFWFTSSLYVIDFRSFPDLFLYRHIYICVSIDICLHREILYMPLVCYGIYSLIPLVVSCDKWNILILMKSRLSEFYFMSCTFLDSVVAICDYLKGMEMLSCIFPESYHFSLCLRTMCEILLLLSSVVRRISHKPIWVWVFLFCLDFK